MVSQPSSEHAHTLALFIHETCEDIVPVPFADCQTLVNRITEAQLANCPYPHLPWDKD